MQQGKEKKPRRIRKKIQRDQYEVGLGEKIWTQMRRHQCLPKLRKSESVLNRDYPENGKCKLLPISHPKNNNRFK